MAVLVIDDDQSFCGECGKPAFPNETHHARRAYSAAEAAGCGVQWDQVATHLRYEGEKAALLEAGIRAMRPDLEWIGVLPWDWRVSGHDA